MKKLYERDIIGKISKYLFTDEIIVLHGARQVGKTSIIFWLKKQLEEKSEKTFYLDLEDSRFVKILNKGVSEFLTLLKEEGVLGNAENGRVFIFIDEIQYLENPSSFLKLIADHHMDIKLIVSGSSSFEIKSKFKDSLVGRTVDFEIFNLSFSEFLRFKNINFLNNDTTEKKINELKTLFKEYVLFGGYPKIVLTPEIDKKETYIQQIIDTYVKKDIRDLAHIKDIEKFNKLLEVLSSEVGNMLDVTELSNTCNISKPTIEKYLFILENTYIIRLVRPYHGNIRAELFKTPKIYFYDTGIAHMLWMKELPKTILGNIFENAISAELSKQYGKDFVFYWRTTDRKEIDFILRKKNDVLPIEAKLNFKKGSTKALKYFSENYKIKDYKVVSLEGDKEKSFEVYPWEL